MKRVTDEDITLINETYLICKSYAETARVTGWSPSTVKKYIIENYVSNTKNVEVSIELPPINDTVQSLKKSHLTLLSEEEVNDLKSIQKEILV